MTIEATNRVTPYLGNGATTLFPAGFPVFQASHIKAKLLQVSTGVESDLVQDTDFTVAMTGLTANITYPKPGSGRVTLTSDQKIYIIRDVPLLQGLDLRNGDDFDVELIEKQFDYLTMMLQGVSEEVARAVKVSITSSTTPDQLLAALNAAVAQALAARDAAVVAQVAAESAQAEAVLAKDVAVASSPVLLFTAAWDFIVGSGPAVAVKKTIDEVAEAIRAKIVGIVSGYTRQQYAVPVTVAYAASVTLDADLHQDVTIAATGNLTLNNPTNAAGGKTLFLRLYGTSAHTLAWGSAFRGNADVPLDSVMTAGKCVWYSFRYDYDSTGLHWILMGRVPEA